MPANPVALPTVDEALRALAHPLRRRILEALQGADRSPSELAPLLAARFDVTVAMVWHWVNRFEFPLVKREPGSRF